FHPQFLQLHGERGNSIDLAFGESIFDGEILAGDPTQVAQPALEGPDQVLQILARENLDESDASHLLLRLRVQQRRSECTADQRDEVAPSHSITRSARRRSD